MPRWAPMSGASLPQTRPQNAAKISRPVLRFDVARRLPLARPPTA